MSTKEIRVNSQVTFYADEDLEQFIASGKSLPHDEQHEIEGFLDSEEYPFINTSNGPRLKVETHGIRGFLLYDLEGIKMTSGHVLFTPCAPKYGGSIEFLISYRENQEPQFEAWIWHPQASPRPPKFVSLGPVWRWVERWGRHRVSTPEGERHAFLFQNFYSHKRGRAEIWLWDNDAKPLCIFEGPQSIVPGAPPEGWSKFEIAKLKTSTAPLPRVPRTLGCVGVEVLRNWGAWERLSNNNAWYRDDMPAYVRSMGTAWDLSSWGYRSP